MIKNLFKRFGQWLKARRTEAELNAMTDRELADIGIYRHTLMHTTETNKHLIFLTLWR